jgi:lipoprotein-releasing system permease protein
MKTNIKLAWRNLWRNRRRTLIAISSIIFSVLLASWMRSMQEGSYDSMIENVVKFYSGYLQVQDTAYWEERTLENSMEVSPELIQQIENLKDVTWYRTGWNLLPWQPITSTVNRAWCSELNPAMKTALRRFQKKLKPVNFFNQGDKSVVLGKGLADFLNLSVGDTLVMIGQGYRGISANGLFPVKGIMEHPNQEFDKRLVLLDIETAREFYSAYGLSTSLVVMTGDHYQVDHLKNDIGNLLSPEKTVLTWMEMQPEIEQLIQSDRASGMIMLGILYLVIAFGMFSVIMMMVKERRREFGVIHAVGMKKRKMAIVVLLETLLIGIIGCTIGLVVSYFFCLWFYHNPIPLTGEMATATVQYGMEPYMFFSIQPSLFYNQMILVFFISLFIAIFPVYNIYRLKITAALRA